MRAFFNIFGKNNIYSNIVVVVLHFVIHFSSSSSL